MTSPFVKLGVKPGQPKINGRHDGYFRGGNQEALRENMTEDAHKRRMTALFKGWGTNVRRATGEKFVTDNQKRLKAKRTRIKLNQTVAREAREIQELARKSAEAAMTRMAEIAATSLNEAAAIAAAQVIFDRAYGKANQTTINANLDANGKATDISGKELDARVEQALKRVNELTSRAPKAPESKVEPTDVREPDRDPDSSTVH